MTMDLQGKNVVVVGLGKTGIAASRLLRAKGANVLVNDARQPEEIGARVDEAHTLGIEMVLGTHEGVPLNTADLIVVSPGVPRLSVLDVAEDKGVPVIGEVELASWFIEAPLVAITGTNGKSTTTTLIAQMLEQTGRPVFAGANLGTPLSDAVGTDAAGPDGFVIAELSSFQLERVQHLHANIAVLTNVTDDHLDRYDDFEGYAQAKGNIFRNQLGADTAIIPAGDALCARLAKRSGGAVQTFGEGADAEVDGEAVRVGEITLKLSDTKLRGGHNALNLAAAALAALAAGAEPEHVIAGASATSSLAHRMEHVRTLAGVEYWDDSKATNVGAAVAALSGLPAGQRVLLIAGGRDKGGSYEPLARLMAKRGGLTVTLGEAAAKIEAEFLGSGANTHRVGTLEEAVQVAQSSTTEGDAVLLAPACSSFDMFDSYAQRGDVFQRLVRELEAP